MSEDDRVAVARLEERVAGWMESTNTYRLSLCAKIDKIVDKIELLPCQAREERSKQETKMQTFLWTGAWICIGCIFTLIAVHLGWK